MNNLMIFCPMRAEAKLLASAFKNVSKISNGYAFNFGRIIVAGGQGKEHIIRSVKDNYTDDFIPILFGVCGSLVEQFKVGDFFCASSVVYNSETNLLPMHKIQAFEAGCFITTDIPIVDRDDRKQLFINKGLHFVEMEGFHFAKYFNEQKIFSYMIRIVSDTPTIKFELPLSPEIKKAAFKVSKLITLASFV